MMFGRKLGVIVAIVTSGLMTTGALALDAVSFGTDWLAQGEHGGFYQAVADGTYAEYGLEVTIVQGGPQANNTALLAAGKLTFNMGGAIGGLYAVEQGIPIKHVAAIFQKGPQILMAHPDAGMETFEDLAKADKLILSSTVAGTVFEWMKRRYPEFADVPTQPYTFNSAPFIADKKSVQQGYVTSEPFAIEREAGWAPKVFLLADAGYDPYSTTISTSQALIESNPDLVQRFVDASIIGWYNYLYGDTAAANALIKQDNPDMSDAQLAFSRDKLKEYGIAVSGDAETLGIGCMTDERSAGFFGKLVEIGLLPADLDYTQSYTTAFVCKGVGVDLVR